MSNTQPGLVGAEQLLAFVSHELRGPVTAILGWTNLLLNHRLSPAEQSRALRLIQRSAAIQRRLTNDLMDAVSIATGRLSVRLEPIDDLSHVVDDVVESRRLAAAEKRLELMVSITKPIPLSGDADRLYQALDNLLSNAVKFTPAGGRIDVTCARGGAEALISVRDNGPGITPAESAWLFERFWQGRVAENKPGMGLGLAIAKLIVELHGGTVQVSSGGRNQGATFTIRLPIGQAASVEVRGTQEAVREASSRRSPAGSSTRVLLVDDDGAVRRALERLLGAWGYDVHAVPNLAGAVDALEHDRFQVALCDLTLCDGNALSLFERLRADVASSCPVIAMSGLGDAAARPALDRGFAAYLEKPILESDLLSAIQSLTGDLHAVAVPSGPR